MFLKRAAFVALIITPTVFCRLPESCLIRVLSHESCLMQDEPGASFECVHPKSSRRKRAGLAPLWAAS